MNSTFSRFCIHRAESPIVAASGCPSTSFSPAPSAAVSRFRASKILRLGLIVADQAGSYVDGLYGGSDRGLYASQYGDEDKVGRLFRLQSGKAWSVTTFRYDVRHQEPGLYVSRSGRILNWAEGHLAVFAHGEWRSAELTEPLHDTHVLDAGDDLYFLTTEALHHIDVENRFSTRRLSWPHDSDGRWRVALWGTHEALVLRYWDPGLYRLDLTSGEIEEATALNEKLGSRKLYDLTAAPDGSVWVLVNDLVRRSYLFVTISTNGKIDIRERDLRHPPRQYWDLHVSRECLV